VKRKVKRREEREKREGKEVSSVLKLNPFFLPFAMKKRKRALTFAEESIDRQLVSFGQTRYARFLCWWYEYIWDGGVDATEEEEGKDERVEEDRPAHRGRLHPKIEKETEKRKGRDESVVERAREERV